MNAHAKEVLDREAAHLELQADRLEGEAKDKRKRLAKAEAEAAEARAIAADLRLSLQPTFIKFDGILTQEILRDLRLSLGGTGQVS